MMKNDKIAAALDSAVISEETADRMYERIRASKAGRGQRKISMIAAAFGIVAVISSVLFVIGTRGESAVVDTPQSNTGIIQDNEDAEIQQGIVDEEWIEEHSSLTQLVIEADKSSAGFYGLLQRFEGDFNELDSIMTSDSILKMPEYLPDGFELSGVIIQLYVTEQDLNEAVQPETSFVSGQKLYQYYQFSDSILDNIKTIQAVYSNNSGEYIHFMAMLSQQPERAEIPGYINVYDAEIAGFDNSFYYTDSKKKFCFADKSIENIEYINIEKIGHQEREAILETALIIMENGCFDTVNYNVWSVTVSTDELLKVLGSLA